jgi:ankyrin repeat protein
MSEEQEQEVFEYARRGRVDDLKEVLEAGVSPDGYKAYDDSSAIHMAAAIGSVSCVECLLKFKANANATKDSGDNVLHVAYKHPEVVECVLKHDISGINSQNEDGMTPLILAAAYGCLDTVQVYIKFGADINIRSSEFGTALYAAKNSTDGDAAGVAELLKNQNAKDEGPTGEEAGATDRFGYGCFDDQANQK